MQAQCRKLRSSKSRGSPHAAGTKRCEWKKRGGVASLQGGCSTARYWRCAAMRARQPWMLQEDMPETPYEGPESAL
jgi:hypothetical protein